MPIEVRELIIKAQVGNKMDTNGRIMNGISDSVSKDEMIKQCVERVLDIIKDKTER